MPRLVFMMSKFAVFAYNGNNRNISISSKRTLTILFRIINFQFDLVKTI